MLQKCSYVKVLEVFFKEPTKVHFVREISRRINLATTSVKNYINELEKENLIVLKESAPFNGYVANRENEKFLFYKQVYNLYSIYELKMRIIEKLGPKAVVLFGSYQRGEDIEESDIDLIVLTKIRRDISLAGFEKNLDRKIHLTFVNSIDKIEKNLQKNVRNGWCIYGEI